MTAPAMTEQVFSASRGCLVQIGSALPDSFKQSLKDRVQTARAEAQHTGSQPAEKASKKVVQSGAVAKGPGPGKKSGPRGKRAVVPNIRSVTVASLIEEGLIKEGDSVKVTHRVKKRSNPSCRSDDGWRSCLINGRSLHDYRSEILEV